MPPEKQIPKSLEINESVAKATSLSIERLRKLKGADNYVATGLSGGVDSSLTAALLVEAGWDVEGLTLWLMKGEGSCCSDGLVDAAGICEQLGIPHHVIDSRSTFEKEIINFLVDGYQQGITPSPCSRCNRSVKFSVMLDWAKKNRGINRIATGHYARIRYAEESNIGLQLPFDSEGRNKLLRGKDKNKDQSYFLYDLEQEIMGRIIFPLGELTKAQTRLEALRYNLRTATKPESQDLCLVEHYGSMKAFLNEYINPIKGKIMLDNGEVIGEHNGIEHFTIGQRKGIGVSWAEPLYVTKIDSKLNRIIVSTKFTSGTYTFEVGEVNWISIHPPEKEINLEVQFRYRSQPVEAKAIPIEAKKTDIEKMRPFRCRVECLDKQFSITPGQAAVFYSGEVLLGGGIIQG